MILRRYDARESDLPFTDLTVGRLTLDPQDELERAKLAVLQYGRRYGPARHGSWARRHPIALGAGLLIAGLWIGRSRVVGGVFAAVALLAARTAAHRLTENVLRHLKV